MILQLYFKSWTFLNRFKCHHQQCKQGITKLRDTLLMMTPESMLSKRSVLRISVNLFFALEAKLKTSSSML